MTTNDATTNEDLLTDAFEAVRAALDVGLDRVIPMLTDAVEEDLKEVTYSSDDPVEVEAAGRIRELLSEASMLSRSLS